MCLCTYSLLHIKPLDWHRALVQGCMREGNASSKSSRQLYSVLLDLIELLIWQAGMLTDSFFTSMC